MDISGPSELLDKVRALPAGRALLDRLGDREGVHLVGGAVRDLLRGVAPSELDLLVEGDPADVLADLGGDAIRYERFGTSTVRLNGFTYDIARARQETYPRPGALPEVKPGSLAEDLRRRDFTVNAIALALAGRDAGRLTPAADALDDLDRRVLRVLHDRSFQDDPTRLLRLARYQARLGFTIDDDTARLASTALRQGALETVSRSRIGTELRLLARETDPVGAFRALRNMGIDRAIHPGLGMEDDELAGRALDFVPDDGHPDRLVLGLAMRAVPAGELWGLLDSLAFGAEDREAILAIATRAEDLKEELAAAGRPSEIALAARGLPPEVVALAGALGEPEAARAWLDDLRHVTLEIDGAELMRAGVPQGPAVGDGLRAALAAKLDGRASDREAELAAALESAQG